MDRIHKHFFNGGVLTPGRVQDLLDLRAEQIETTLVAETARWRWGGTVWTRDNQWQSERSRLRNDFIPRRTDIVINQINMFRENARAGTDLGRLATEYMDRGELVPDEVTIKMLLARLDQPDAAAGAIFDGFPRTVAQAEALLEVGREWVRHDTLLVQLS